MFILLRPLRVFFTLLPFVVSFLRDWRGYVLFGAPRELTESQHRARARALARVCARLGPAFVKGAQVLAAREDILPKTYTTALKSLQDRVPPFPLEQVLKTIRAETGKNARDLFESFEDEPIAAASLGQVHRATYKGEVVAVKVLRPNVERIVEVDLKVLLFIIRIFDFFIDNYFVRNFWTVLKEYERVIHQEMDFRSERRNAERLRRNFAKDPRVRIPACYAELTSRRLAVFEFIEGHRVDTPDAFARTGLTPEALIERLIEIYVRMTIVHGFVHADPHPGNLLIDAEGRLVILDYGMAIEFTDEVRLEMLRGCIAVVRGDVDTLVGSFYKLDMVEPDINRAKVRDAASTLLRIQYREDFSPRMVQEIADDILATFHKFPLRMPQQLVYLFRASALIEGLGMEFVPHFSAVREATPVIKRLMAEIALQPDKPIKERVLDFANQTYNILSHVRRIIEQFEREEQRVRIHPADVNRFESFLSSLMRRLLIGAASLGIVAAGGVYHLATGTVWVPAAMAIPAGIVFLFNLVLPVRPRS